jgi:hypothetical protein
MNLSDFSPQILWRERLYSYQFTVSLSQLFPSDPCCRTCLWRTVWFTRVSSTTRCFPSTRIMRLPADASLQLTSQTSKAFYTTAALLTADLSLWERTVQADFFWDVGPCSLVKINRRFRGVYCLHVQYDKASESELVRWNTGEDRTRQKFVQASIIRAMNEATVNR